MRNSIVASIAAAAAVLAVWYVANPPRNSVSASPRVHIEGIPKMPNPPGPRRNGHVRNWWGPASATSRSGAADDASRAARSRSGSPMRRLAAWRPGTRSGGEAESNDPFITCDPLAFHATCWPTRSPPGRTLFATAPAASSSGTSSSASGVRSDGRPRAAEGRGPAGARPNRATTDSPSATGRTTTTLVIDTTGFDERPWLDEEGHPRSSMRTSRSATRAWINTTSS